VFKKSNRSANEAAHQAAQKTFERIHEYISGLPKDAVVIRVAFNGLLGVAREAVVAALMQDKNAPIRSLIRQIVDVTPVKIRGVRARKPRR
jgi:small subunit ribosomal protein S11